jgi:hypothetical protein
LEDKELRQIPLVALFTALGIIFPQFFHLLGLGSAFLPMFLPVMVGSMLLSWRYVLLMAFLCPVISWLLTSMPPIAPPILPVLTIELIVVSLVISLLRFYSNLSVWLILIFAIVIDRLVLLGMILIIAPWFGIDHPLFSIGIIAAGIPGIVLQIVTIPYAVYLIEKKYPQWKPKQDN